MCCCSTDPQAPSQSTVLKDKDENAEEFLETFETMQVYVNGFKVNIMTYYHLMIEAYNLFSILC